MDTQTHPTSSNWPRLGGMSTAHAPAVTPLILPAGIWDIDHHHSNVEFVARHLFSRVRGRFTDFDGTITVDPDPDGSAVEVTVQAASISTDNEERDVHLRTSISSTSSASPCFRSAARR